MGLLPASGSYDVGVSRRTPGAGREDPRYSKAGLWEETGAKEFVLSPVCVCSVLKTDGVLKNPEETFGMLSFAEIHEFGPLPPLEIKGVRLFRELPENWTYPEIQPKLLRRVSKFLAEK